MVTPPKIIPDKIHIQRMRVMTGNIACPLEITNDNDLVDGYDTLFKAQTQVNYGTERIRILFSVKFDAVKDGIKIPISADYTIEFIIAIDNFSDYVVRVDENNPQLHQILGATLMGIIYSTSRGILATRTQGTILEGIILPVIDPNALLNKDGYKAFTHETVEIDLKTN